MSCRTCSNSKPARVDLARGEAPEHERVVGIRAVAEVDQHRGRRGYRNAAVHLTGVPKLALSDAIQDYLKALYHLQTGEGRVSVTALAREQKVSPASASAMVKKLAALELVEHAPYRGVRLTRAGEKVARRGDPAPPAARALPRRARSACTSTRVHEEADRLEHALSEELEAKIDSALGYPTHDPHGDRSPTRSSSGRSSYPPEEPAL